MGHAIAADSAVMARALGGPLLELTMRGTTVAVVAAATPADGGCTTQVTAHAPGKNRRYSRLFRWSEVAWAGATAEGRTKVAFFEHEGRLPGDTLVFAPQDGAAFRSALARVVAACRAVRAEAERTLVGAVGLTRSCYFARLPQLQLHDAEAPHAAFGPPRAVLTVLSRENPEAELQILLEQNQPGGHGKGDDWGSPAVAFTFADPRLAEMRIAAAEFALDARPVVADHSITAFGDTRVRIAMDSLRRPGGGAAPERFYKRMAGSGAVTLTLLGAANERRAVLTFDVGPALAAARLALAGANWSCAAASPAPAPAARWQPAP